MADAPIAAWLHIGPNSHATVTVTFIGTTKAFSLTQTQAYRLEAALRRARQTICRDDGERMRTVAINLLEGVDA